CLHCGAGMQADARFCTHCGKDLDRQKCLHCNEPLSEDARFCTTCGTRVARAKPGPDVTSVQSLVAAIEFTLQEAQPDRILQASLQCLDRNPTADCGATVCLLSMVAHARLGNFDAAQSQLTKAREYCSDFLSLAGEHRS